MQKLGVIVNTQKPRAEAVLGCLVALARKTGIELLLAPDARCLVPDIETLPDDEGLAAADAVMALGGDGTMLAAVRRLAAISNPLPPLIGLNIGSLGFMTSVTESDMQAALECMRDQNFSVSERSLAACEVMRSGHSVLGKHQGLNDVVVRNGATTRVVMLEVSIDTSLVTTYVCDGVIVSTPTGSTGYSLSADGPIVLPETSAFVISVICPHTLSSRPLVVPDRSVIRIKVCGPALGLRISVDGQDEHELIADDVVEIRRSTQRVRFLHLPTHDYFAVLRQKLNWSGSAVRPH
ncbi:MAG: NAD(+)/NADH kinase [Kiritimatiellia bacterium]